MHWWLGHEKPLAFLTDGFNLILLCLLYLRFNLENFQQLQALIFAVEEINANPNILPNITLGFQAYDSCNVLQKDLEGMFQILTGYSGAIPNYRCLKNIPVAAVIGPYVSTHAILLANILGVYRYPQISHFATSRLLSNHMMFPSFFRTVPSDAFQSQGLAKLVLFFGWTWVGLLAVDNDYGQQGIQVVKQEIEKAGACVAFSETILMSLPDRNAKHIVKVIKDSTATAIVVFSLPADFLPVLEEMLVQNITKKMLVASEGWFLNKAHPSRGLGKYWLKLLWEEIFTCKFLEEKNLTAPTEKPANICTGMESLESISNNYNDISSLRTTYNVYTAVHVVAKALEDLKNCCDLLYFMRKVRIKLSSGRDLFFDQNGDPPAVYDIVNWKLSPEGTIKQVKVGSYDTAASFGQVFTVNTSAIVWATGDQVPVSVCSQSCPPGFRKAPISGKPACCFKCIPCPQGEISNHTDSIDCFKCSWEEWPNLQNSKCIQKGIEYLSYEDPLGATLAAISILSSLVPVFILRLFIKHRTTPIVKANNYSLSCLLLLCLPLCFLCSLAFVGFPQPEKCLLCQAAFGLVFALCVSCILAKTIMVVLAFMATKPVSKLRRWASPLVSYMIISLCFLLQFLLCTVWLLKAPPYTEYDTQTKPGLIIVQCNNGSTAAFWSMLGYLGLLATISFIVAFLSRGLPDTFNEAKYITFSMLAFLSVWASYTLASFSAQGKYTVATEIFAILSSSWALVVCMFASKCYIILFRPLLNSKKSLMKNDSRNIKSKYKT
uniref:G-protein coupled receptors family 3 profile domain-containing protein n=2 Tax=Xenopus tropicalis TaxID=8364 RepID=A0A803J7A9_XENTR